MVQTTEDQKIISKWQERIKRGFLWITILRLFDQKAPLSGTDIKTKINEMNPHWDPSPGSIYPILKELEKDGLIVQVDHPDKKNKIYTITERGSNLLIALRNDVFAFRMHPVEFLKRMGQNEKEFKEKFSSMISNIPPEELDAVTVHFTNILHWFEDLLFQSKSITK